MVAHGEYTERKFCLAMRGERENDGNNKQQRLKRQAVNLAFGIMIPAWHEGCPAKTVLD